MIKVEKLLTVALLVAAVLLILVTLNGCAPLAGPLPSTDLPPTAALPAPTQADPALMPSAPGPTADPDAPVSSDDPATNTPPPPRPPAGGIKLGEEGYIEELDVRILESFPVQVHAVIRGQLPDGCTSIEEVRSSREGQRFTLEVITARPTGKHCTQVLVPFEETVALDVLGLEAGTYTVQARDVTATFELEMDNFLAEIGGPGPIAADCPVPGPEQAVFMDEARSFCFLYPQDFTAGPADRPFLALIRGPEYSQGPGVLPASLSISALDARGRSLAQFAAGLADEYPGAALEIEQITLGDGTPAVAVKGQPGTVPGRVVYVEYFDQILVLSFQPLGAESAGPAADLERLYGLLVESWTRIEE